MSWPTLEFDLIDKGNQFPYSLPIRAIRLAVGLLQPSFLHRDQSTEQHHVDDKHRQESPRSQQANTARSSIELIIRQRQPADAHSTILRDASQNLGGFVEPILLELLRLFPRKLRLPLDFRFFHAITVGNVEIAVDFLSAGLCQICKY